MTDKDLQIIERWKKDRRKGMFSKLIIALILALNIAFTVAVLWVFLRTQTEPSSLVVAWFSFTTIELWSLAQIKKHKLKGD